MNLKCGTVVSSVLRNILNRKLWQYLLKQRQNKNDSIDSKTIPILILQLFFPHRIGGEKARQIQGWNYF